MKDLRNYKEVAKRALEQERKNDANWSWSLKGISKDEIKIGWTYLDYIGEKEPFRIELIAYDDGKVEGLMGVAGDHKTFVIIGETRWDDVATIEEGIELAVRKIARIAHNCY